MENIIKHTMNEFSRLLTSRGILILGIIVPVFSVLLYGFTYKYEIIREIPIAVVDNDHSSLSRKIINFLDASSSLKISKRLDNINYIENEVKSKNVFGVFYFPKNFEKEIKNSKSSTVILYKNSQNILLNNIIFEAAFTTIKTISAGVIIKKVESQKIEHSRALFFAMPVKLESHLLYNPNYSYQFYLVPGFLLFTLQMVILLVSSSESFTIFKSENVYLSIFSKYLTYTFFHLIISAILFLILKLFNIKYNINFFRALLFTIIFIIVNISIGIFISILIKDKIFRTELLVFINTPAFIFSGFTFPIESMPAGHQLIASLMPFTYLLKLFIKMFNMNLPLTFCLKEFFVTIGTSLLFLALTFIKIRMKSSEE